MLQFSKLFISVCVLFIFTSCKSTAPSPEQLSQAASKADELEVSPTNEDRLLSLSRPSEKATADDLALYFISIKSAPYGKNAIAQINFASKGPATSFVYKLCPVLLANNPACSEVSKICQKDSEVCPWLNKHCEAAEKASCHTTATSQFTVNLLDLQPGRYELSAKACFYALDSDGEYAALCGPVSEAMIYEQQAPTDAYAWGYQHWEAALTQQIRSYAQEIAVNLSQFRKNSQEEASCMNDSDSLDLVYAQQVLGPDELLAALEFFSNDTPLSTRSQAVTLAQLSRGLIDEPALPDSMLGEGGLSSIQFSFLVTPLNSSEANMNPNGLRALLVKKLAERSINKEDYAVSPSLLWQMLDSALSVDDKWPGLCQAKHSYVAWSKSLVTKLVQMKSQLVLARES